MFGSWFRWSHCKTCHWFLWKYICKKETPWLRPKMWWWHFPFWISEGRICLLQPGKDLLPLENGRVMSTPGKHARERSWLPAFNAIHEGSWFRSTRPWHRPHRRGTVYPLGCSRLVLEVRDVWDSVLWQQVALTTLSPEAQSWVEIVPVASVCTMLPSSGMQDKSLLRMSSLVLLDRTNDT